MKMVPSMLAAAFLIPLAVATTTSVPMTPGNVDVVSCPNTVYVTPYAKKVVIICPSNITATPTLISTPSPSPTATIVATKYEVDNPNSQLANLHHTFLDNQQDVVYTIFDSLPANQSRTYDTGQMSQLPRPFSGSVNIYSTLPITAEIVH